MGEQLPFGDRADAALAIAKGLEDAGVARVWLKPEIRFCAAIVITHRIVLFWRKRQNSTPKRLGSTCGSSSAASIGGKDSLRIRSRRFVHMSCVSGIGAVTVLHAIALAASGCGRSERSVREDNHIRRPLWLTKMSTHCSSTSMCYGNAVSPRGTRELPQLPVPAALRFAECSGYDCRTIGRWRGSTVSLPVERHVDLPHAIRDRLP